MHFFCAGLGAGGAVLSFIAMCFSFSRGHSIANFASNASNVIMIVFWDVMMSRVVLYRVLQEEMWNLILILN